MRKEKSKRIFLVIFKISLENSEAKRIALVVPNMKVDRSNMIRLIISLKLVLKPDSEEYKLAMQQLLLDREDILEACKFQNEEELLVILMSLAEYFITQVTPIELTLTTPRSLRPLNSEFS